MKKVISVFLAALFVFSCINLSFIPVNAITDYTTGVTEDGFDYIIDNETGELTVTWVEDYSITDLVIPSYIDGHPVTAIGAHFLGDTQYENVRSVVIPDTVTRIEYNAFADRETLESVVMSKNIEYVGDCVFANTELTNNAENWVDGALYIGNLLYGVSLDYSGVFTIKDGTTSIAPFCFSSRSSWHGCDGITDVIIPDSVKYIGLRAFCGCTGLESITIPDSVTYIDNVAFDGCSNLTDINIDASSLKYIGQDILRETAYYYDDANWQNDVLYLDSAALCGRNTISNLKIKEGTEIIADYAFACNDNIVSVSLPDSMRIICDLAFDDLHALPSIELPDGIEYIGKSAFDGCDLLTELDIPFSVNYIGLFAFNRTDKLEKLIIRNPHCTIIDNHEEYAGGAYSVHANTTVYGYLGSTAEAFANNNGVSFAEIQVETGNAGYYCSWSFDEVSGLLMISGNGEMGVYTSEYDATEKVSITTAPWNKYRDKLKAVIICDGVKNVGQFSFSGCTELRNVELSKTVIAIGASAFSYCTKLEKINIPFGIKRIENYTFFRDYALKSIAFPNSVSEIGAHAFEQCKSMTIVDFSESLETIENDAFWTCESLKQITIPNSVKSIGNYAFAHCKSVENLDFGNGVTTIGTSAFSECEYLETVVIPDSVTSLGTAFNDCVNLKTIVIGKGIKSINSLYHGYKSLETLILSEGLETLDYYSFQNCPNLKNITIPSSLKEVDANSFLNCDNIKYIFYEGNQGNWNDTYNLDYVFSWYSPYIHYNAEDHTFKEELIVKEATCVEKGILKHKCSYCDAISSETEEIPAKGHSYIETVIPPTYINKGYTTYCCENCGDTYIDNYVDAIEPTTAEPTTVEPTTIEPTTVEPTTVEPTTVEPTTEHNHFAVADKGYPATCTGTGLTEGSHCSVCGEVIKAQVIVPATGHTPAVDKAKSATCTETGLTEGCHCSTCGEIIKAQEVILATGHTMVIDKAKAPTCTETGLTEGSHCSVCGEIIKAQEIIPAKHHTPAVDEAKPATCTETGLTEGYHCSVCGIIAKVQEVIPAKGHTLVLDKGKAPTCTETGLTEGSHCSVCGEIIKTQNIIPATGHTEVIDKGKAPTCTETGLTDGSHCSVCGEIIKAQEIIPSTGHTEVIDKAKPATCTESGLTEGSHCSVCGEIIKAQEIIPATGHDWDNGTVTKAADCHHDGEMTYSCSKCQEKKTEVIPMLEHQWNDGTVTKEPTYTEPGEIKYTCSLCGDTRTESVPCKEKKGKLTISNETVRAGDEVTVKLYLDENPGITALSINVNFPNRFILKDVQYMGLFPNQPSSSPMNYNPFTVSWASPTSTDIDNTGLFAILTFDVGIDVPLADYPITVTYNAENVFDSAFVNVPLDIENGTVSVLKPTPGDVNRDGNINMKDLVLIQQLINRWDVQIVESAADVNDDGEINMKDLVLLQRYINGWEVVLK